MVGPFPKIYDLGHRYVQNIFNEDVEITEKIDGSQFAFGKIDNDLIFRSRRAEIYDTSFGEDYKYPNIKNLFLKGIDYISTSKNVLHHF